MQNMKYGAERKFICTTCGRENLNRTDLHHVIGQAFIKTRAKRWQLEYLANDILSDDYMKSLNDSELINVIVNKNPRNIIEMCQTCHKMTTSYQQYLDYKDKNSKPRKSKTRTRSKRKWSRNQCLGVNSKGEKCKKRNGKFTNGYCSHHVDQFGKEKVTIEVDENNLPELHSEGWLEEFEVEEIAMWKQLGLEPNRSLFKDKSDAWKKRWLS